MNNLLETLRRETSSLHEQTEQRLYTAELRAGVLSVLQYEHLLLIHGAFHYALEEAIDLNSNFFHDYRPESRRKTPWIEADLAQLQVDLYQTPDLFTDWTPFELVGAAYVGEGSMLGGKTVWHYLQQSDELAPLLNNARFYRGYGATTGQKWRDFGAFADQQAVGHHEAAVRGARLAFSHYQKLFDQIKPTD